MPAALAGRPCGAGRVDAFFEAAETTPCARDRDRSPPGPRLGLPRLGSREPGPEGDRPSQKRAHQRAGQAERQALCGLAQRPGATLNRRQRALAPLHRQAPTGPFARMQARIVKVMASSGSPDPVLSGAIIHSRSFAGNGPGIHRRVPTHANKAFLIHRNRADRPRTGKDIAPPNDRTIVRKSP